MRDTSTQEQHAKLVQQAVAGDRAAFGLLVDHYKRVVFAYALKRTRDFVQSQDITQEAFIEAYLSLSKLRQPTKFGNWLLGITRNLCSKAHTQQQVLVDMGLSLETFHQEVTYQWIAEPNHGESWEVGLQAAIKLSTEEKTLLKSFYLDETSCREIAHQGGTSEVSIRKRLSRTRQKLRSELLKGGSEMNKVIAVGAVITMLSTPVLAGTFMDNFDAGHYADGWEILDHVDVGSIWMVEEGELICRRSSLWISTLQFGELDWRNYSIEADARMVQVLNPDFHYMGFETRLGDDGSYVWLTTGEGPQTGPAAWIWAGGPGAGSGGKDADTVNRDFKPELNRWYHLKAAAHENTFELYVDGERVVTLDFASAPKGRLGLSVGGALAHFDNVVITGDDVPDSTDGVAAVSDLDKLTTTWGETKTAQ